MITVETAIAAIVLAALIAQDTTAGPQFLFSEPIVGAAIFGWLLGCGSTALLIGIAIQLIWSGAVPAGSARFIDVNVGTATAVTVCALCGGGTGIPELSMLWVIPVGLMGSVLTDLNRRINGRIVVGIVPENTTPRSITVRQWTGWTLSGIRGMLTFVLGSAAGILIIPVLASVIEPYFVPHLYWAGVFGAGGGVAVAATWRYSKGKAALLGVLAAVGAWIAGLRPFVEGFGT